MKRLNKRLDIIRAENEHYASLAKEIPDYKQEVFHLKSTNFDLQREVANLRSQLEESKNNYQHLQSILQNGAKIKEPISTQLLMTADDSRKEQFWQLQDENLKLRSEMAKIRLDLKSSRDEVKRLEISHDTLDNINLEMSAANQKLTSKLREIEANQQSMQRSKLTLEQNLSVFQSERESFVKSRNFYRDQMHQAQESRSAIQHELISVQADLAAKSNQIEKIKIEQLGVKKTLDDEREKALQEKEEMKRQLEDLELSLIDSEKINCLILNNDCDEGDEQENFTSQIREPTEELQKKQFWKIQHENVSLRADIARLKMDLKSCQDDIESEEMLDNTEELKIQLDILKNDILEFESKNEALEGKMKMFENINKDLKMHLKESDLKIKHLNEERTEIEASKKLLIEELDVKNDLIVELKDAKLNAEINAKRTKDEFNDIRLSFQKEYDENKELKEELRKVKEKSEKQLNQFEALELDYKHAKMEQNVLKQDLENAKGLQFENISLKKQLLNHDRQMLEENETLKKAFAASDEARKELENAFDKVKSENESMRNELSNHLNDSIELEKEIAQRESHEQIIYDRTVENEKLKEDFENLKVKFETLRAENIAMFENSGQEDEGELKMFQSQKISRLENSLKIFEDEIRRLNNKNADLEDQILTLEHKNGRLIMDSTQNSCLKHKIQTLQEEIAIDTALRKELLSSLELAKSSLKTEIQNLEKGLKSEKESHCETKNRLMLLEHECSTLRVDRRSLRTGLETANLTIEKIKAEKSVNESVPLKVDDETNEDMMKQLQLSKAHLKEVKSTYEDSKRNIQTLEDQLNEIRFQLKQKHSEITSLQAVLKAKEESYDSEVTEFRSKNDHMRVELVNLTRKLDKLSEEKNGYRGQVQDMNMALKNSLEHIKRLRSINPLENQVEWNELITLNSSKKFDLPCENPVQPKQNLANLQNCLASLKYEMAVLQKKLAPSSVSNSPQKKLTALPDIAKNVDENIVVIKDE